MAAKSKNLTKLKSKKSVVGATLLALLPGIFGLWGLGHMYAGKWWKGGALLILGIILAALFYTSLSVLSIIVIMGWIWQTVDAYKTVVAYNKGQ